MYQYLCVSSSRSPAHYHKHTNPQPYHLLHTFFPLQSRDSTHGAKWYCSHHHLLLRILRKSQTQNRHIHLNHCRIEKNLHYIQSQLICTLLLSFFLLVCPAPRCCFVHNTSICCLRLLVLLHQNVGCIAPMKHP